MAIPELYWMLECKKCGARLVVHDSYLKFVGTSLPNPAPGSGYGGPPLPERYGCIKGCSRSMKALGCIDTPDDRTMWLNEPHVPIEMTMARSREWQRLIQEADYAGNPDVTFTGPGVRPEWTEKDLERTADHLADLRAKLPEGHPLLDQLSIADANLQEISDGAQGKRAEVSSATAPRDNKRWWRFWN